MSDPLATNDPPASALPQADTAIRSSNGERPPREDYGIQPPGSTKDASADYDEGMIKDKISATANAG